MESKSIVMARLWQRLHGTWQLQRKLHSMNAGEPSGNCTGQATFTPRTPAVFIDNDGKLQNASKEMLYSEQGNFEMTDGNVALQAPKFSFSRKYVWRLNDEKTSNPEISIWFVKPGTDQIDYLFHKFLLQSVSEKGANDLTSTLIECSGGHLCVEDFYSSTYTFNLSSKSTGNTAVDILDSWTMHHEVQGPKKDQIIETIFRHQFGKAV